MYSSSVDDGQWDESIKTYWTNSFNTVIHIVSHYIYYMFIFYMKKSYTFIEEQETLV